MRIHVIGTVIVARKASAIEAWENYGVVCTDLTTTYGSPMNLATFLADMAARRNIRIEVGQPVTNPTAADIAKRLQEAYRQVMRPKGVESTADRAHDTHRWLVLH